MLPFPQPREAGTSPSGGTSPPHSPLSAPKTLLGLCAWERPSSMYLIALTHPCPQCCEDLCLTHGHRDGQACEGHNPVWL